MDILIPEVGESVREALLAQWFKKNGDQVAKDEPLCELETDKITLDINADAAGVLTILVEAGATLPIGTKIGTISERAESTAHAASVTSPSAALLRSDVATSPSVRLALRENNIDPTGVSASGKGGRITLDDLFHRIEQKSRPVDEAPDSAMPLPEQVDGYQPVAASPVNPPVSAIPSHTTAIFSGTATPAAVQSEELPRSGMLSREDRVTMSPIRKRIAERMVAARQQTAMLTTFNEVDMSRIKELRQKYRQHFIDRHGTPPGLMPFFVKACCLALAEFPLLNASIEGDQIVYHHFYDIGIAIGAEKGLVVPVLRNADTMKLFEIDAAVAAFTEKISANKLSVSDLEGGTFTISNGGVYGSLLSTPILNPPQSGILGMHAIQDRPVVHEGQIVIRPMMNLALSYDHRLVDGRDAVSFLKKIREYCEEPEELLLEG